MTKSKYNLATKMVASLVLISLFWSKLLYNGVSCSMEGEMMSAWADKFGEELWDLAEKMTKVQGIKSKYKQFNARVETKNGSELMDYIANNVGRMLRRKMDAIRCIVNEAEQAAEQFEANETERENFQYYSSRYSPIAGQNIDPEQLWPPGIYDNRKTYKVMSFYQDTHFYNLSVNTSYSSVHVPSNVYDHGAEVLEALMWSESLDEVFIQNYKTDPALSWQYFGSDTGILRHYPAMAWQHHGEENYADTYDCRKKSWFIETATCSKDVVILLDNSGSMTGYRNYIAQLTIKSLLDTFSNNDFVNIFNFSSSVGQIMKCFNKSLVQATPENIRVLNDAVVDLQPEGFANHSAALEYAFQVLEMYRSKRGCSESKQGCNQAIMLITDGIPTNLTDVFETYNNFENGTQKPVRLFTYLLGKEVAKVRDIQLMACLNRGHFSHIETLDQVQEEVLKYVNIIANPLILQSVKHPPTWTHAFLDLNWQPSEDEKSLELPRLMIAVGAPAFDRRFNSSSNDTQYGPRLLGVAGTDVSVEELDKLTLPYKLGVNAYSFIVSNNGYVLLHPDLRPVYKGILKENYNSIDLAEIEQYDDDSCGAREPHPQILELRQKIVNSEDGKMTDVPIRFHYDKMRRVAQEKQDYYFAPLPNTPFALGIALPSDYGNTWIKVGDEVKKNQHLGINISDFFVGENWKIHPGWVYCKYHYLEGHEFKTPEEELRHFLTKMGENDWKWTEQYESDGSEGDSYEEPNCGRKSLDDDAYYCNKELVQLLVFDAKVTNDSFQKWEFADENEQEIIKRFNAELRFVATMSGLTRWQFIYGEVEVANDTEFGDYHTQAIDETWYRAAVLQHKIDPHSFFYSVQHHGDEKERNGSIVTASMAIFPRDGGLESPSCVVGFQFNRINMYNRFMEITSKSNCDGCIKTCDDPEADCYVIDSNGYIVLSEDDTDVGRFFGAVEGEVINAMVQDNIFKSITVYDLQALCISPADETTSDGPRLLTPLKMLTFGVNWLLAELFRLLGQVQMYALGIPDYDTMDEYDDCMVETCRKGKGRKVTETMTDENGELVEEVKQPVKPPKPRACDNSSTLYTVNLNNTGFKTDTYFIKRIPRSNLLLVVVNSTYPRIDPDLKSNDTTQSIEIIHPGEFPCHKLNLNDLPRRRLEECFTEHPAEEEFAQCGFGSLTVLPKVTLMLLCLQLIFAHFVTFRVTARINI